jgi:CO/xanthine dehydrogenase FAD-binding subunit
MTTAIVNSYTAPQSLEEAAGIAAETDVTIFAGGTDLLPRWSRQDAPRPTAILDVKGIERLSGIRIEDDEVCVGACTLMSDLHADPVIRAAAPMLGEAAGRVACAQIRNRATLGGNLCNASPAADTAVPLILLDARLELASSGPQRLATRGITITDFFRGPGSTVLKRGEILTRIRFQALPTGSYWAWDKFGTRPAMEIAVASVGMVLQRKENRITHARVGYGSVAPVPLRGHQVEQELVGKRLEEDVIDRCVAAARGEIKPVSDIRATAEYRRELVGVMVRRMLENAQRS